MRSKERSRQEEGAPWLSAMCWLLKGGMVAGAVTIACLLAAACAVSLGWLGQGEMEGATLGCCVIGSMLGGLMAAKRHGSRALLMGLGVGVVLFLILVTAGLLAYGEISVLGGGIGTLCACACGGGIAGLAGRGGKKKRKR